MVKMVGAVLCGIALSASAADIAFNDPSRRSCNPPMITKAKTQTARLMSTLPGVLKP